MSLLQHAITRRSAKNGVRLSIVVYNGRAASDDIYFRMVGGPRLVELARGLDYIAVAQGRARCAGYRLTLAGLELTSPLIEKENGTCESDGR